MTEFNPAFLQSQLENELWETYDVSELEVWLIVNSFTMKKEQLLDAVEKITTYKPNQSTPTPKLILMLFDWLVDNREITSIASDNDTLFYSQPYDDYEYTLMFWQSNPSHLFYSRLSDIL